MSKVLRNLREAIEDGDMDEVVELVQEALDDEVPAQEILNDGLIEGMNEVGDMFKDGEMYVPEVLMSANAMDAGMEILKPYLKEGDVKKVGKVVFCTVKGDLHDIGKKLCVMMMEGGGFDVVDLGVDVGVEDIMAAVEDHQPNILAMSAMLTTTMVTMDEAVNALEEAGKDDIKVMVGGAPLSGDYAENISANYSEDAIAAVALANKLLGN